VNSAYALFLFQVKPRLNRDQFKYYHEQETFDIDESLIDQPIDYDYVIMHVKRMEYFS
jgi:hypothetical protein